MLITLNINAFASTTFKIITGILCIAASAHIAIPLTPVPLTLHTVIVMLIGLLYTPKEAALTTLLYIALGIAGAPIFKSGASGVAYATGTTGGYLLGFAVAATFIAFAKRHITNSHFSLLMLLATAHAIIYLFGVSWLSFFIGFEQAIYSGCLVFLPTGILKTVALTTALHFLGYQAPTKRS